MLADVKILCVWVIVTTHVWRHVPQCEWEHLQLYLSLPYACLALYQHRLGYSQKGKINAPANKSVCIKIEHEKIKNCRWLVKVGDVVTDVNTNLLQ